MARVICTHRHASGAINGVRFDPHDLGRISEEISEEQAKGFLSIPGYVSEDGISNTKIEAAETPNVDAGNFMPSSFADQHARMPTTLQDASPGWETKDEQTDSTADGASEKNAAAAGPANMSKAIAKPVTKK